MSCTTSAPSGRGRLEPRDPLETSGCTIASSRRRASSSANTIAPSAGRSSSPSAVSTSAPNSSTTAAALACPAPPPRGPAGRRRSRPPRARARIAETVLLPEATPPVSPTRFAVTGGEYRSMPTDPVPRRLLARRVHRRRARQPRLAAVDAGRRRRRQPLPRVHQGRRRARDGRHDVRVDQPRTTPAQWFYDDRPTLGVHPPRAAGASRARTCGFTSDDVREVHAAMVEAAGGRNVWLVGGGELVGQFLDHDLLDETDRVRDPGPARQRAPRCCRGGAPSRCGCCRRRRHRRRRSSTCTTRCAERARPGRMTAMAHVEIRPGDRVALLVPGSAEYVDLVMGLLAAGMFPVPLDPRLTASERAGILEDIEPRLVVDTPELRGVAAREHRPSGSGAGSRWPGRCTSPAAPPAGRRASARACSTSARPGPWSPRSATCGASPPTT